MLSGFAIIPSLHLIWLEGYKGIAEIFVKEMWTEYMIYGIGVLLYAMKIPERFAPGRFDLIGQGHQLFHIFVLGGILSHYKLLMNSMTYQMYKNPECF
jgi:predicted membrane channel-forming protein YqfA (hemolysin III family)